MPMVVEQSQDDVYKLCNCGRFKEPQHCVFCGSSFVYGRSTKSKRFQTWDAEHAKIVEFTIRNFYCRRCNKEFFEDQPCEAAPARKKDKMRVANINTESRQRESSAIDTSAFGKQLRERLAKTNPALAEAVKEFDAHKDEHFSSSLPTEEVKEDIPIRGTAAGEFKDEIFGDSSLPEITEDKDE